MSNKIITRRFYGPKFKNPTGLLDIQTDSFAKFVQVDVAPDLRKKTGLQYLFSSFFPIKRSDGSGSIEFVSYEIEAPKNSPEKCRDKQLTYEALIKATFRLTSLHDGKIQDIKEQTLPMMHFPMMDDTGVFIVNGVDKTVLSQIVRSPGATILKNKQDETYKATVIPDYGAWLQFEFDRKTGDIIVRIDNSAGLPAKLFFYALGASDEGVSRLCPELPESVDYVHDKSISPDRAVWARYELFRRLKKYDIPTADSANRWFTAFFMTPGRYDLSPTGRVRLNKKTGLKIPLDNMLLDCEDMIAITQLLITAKKKDTGSDNIDALQNKVIKQFHWQMTEYLREAFVPMAKEAAILLSSAHLPDKMPSNFIITRLFAGAITKFFNTNPLCQFAQQTNILADLIQKRKLNATGKGGLDRDGASIEARDIQTSQYGRICPIDTPEGKSIGIVSTISSYARVNDLGILETPYYRVKDRIVVTDTAVYLEPDDEKYYVIADFNSIVDGKIPEGFMIARVDGEPQMVDSAKINMVDYSPCQLVSVATALVPFLEHNDGHRALMATNMQKQAVPLLRPEAPLVGTGMERIIGMASPHVLKAASDGVVECVDSTRIIIKNYGSRSTSIYKLKKFKGTNQGTWINQKPVVSIGDAVRKGQLIADGPAMVNGELALGKNLLVAYMSFAGLGYEDSIIISERLVKENILDSIHIKHFEINEYNTQLGKEEFTGDIRDINEYFLRNLDKESGIVRIGTYVREGDYLVGKVAPKGEQSLTPEETLLRSIFGNTAAQVKDTSLRVPPGIDGVVISVNVLSRTLEGKERSEEFGSEKQSINKAMNDEIEIVRAIYAKKIQQIINTFPDIFVAPGRKKKGSAIVATPVIKAESATDEDTPTPSPSLANKTIVSNAATVKAYTLYDCNVNLHSNADDASKERLNTLLLEYRGDVDVIRSTYKERKTEHREVDELPEGVRKRAVISIAVRRRPQPGDKLAGRYGNKGVISRVLPVEDMPMMDDGTPVDIILNPLGCPSRMNIGQLIETQFGLALTKAGQAAADMAKNGSTEDELRGYIKSLYTEDKILQTLDKMNHQELKKVALSLENGLTIASPVFAGANENDMQNMVSKTGLPERGTFRLRDGRSGEYFDKPTLVGRKFIMKLYHLVEDKMHARAVGPYSAITQQPLKGRGKHGGQRLGEMELWALYSYGAAYNLLEFTTVKSDDIEGREDMFNQIVQNGQFSLDSRGPGAAYNVLENELKSLCLFPERIKDGVAIEVRKEEKDAFDRTMKKISGDLPAIRAQSENKAKKDRERIRKRRDQVIAMEAAREANMDD